MKKAFKPQSKVYVALGLCLGQVVGYANCSNTFWSCDLGRNGGDLLCGGIFLLLQKKNCKTMWRYAQGDVISFININKYKMVEQ